MKKNNAKKLYFNSLSITELNSKQLRKIRAGSDGAGSVVLPPPAEEFLNTQTNPKDGYSLHCLEDPITE